MKNNYFISNISNTEILNSQDKTNIKPLHENGQLDYIKLVLRIRQSQGWIHLRDDILHLDVLPIIADWRPTLKRHGRHMTIRLRQNQSVILRWTVRPPGSRQSSETEQFLMSIIFTIYKYAYSHTNGNY